MSGLVPACFHVLYTHHELRAVEVNAVAMEVNERVIGGRVVQVECGTAGANLDKLR